MPDRRPAAPSSPEPAKLPLRSVTGPWVRRVVLFVACVVALEGLIGERGLAETLRARRDLQRAAADLTVLRHANQRLRQEAQSLRHDLGSIEELARRELGLVKAGEVLVILKDVPK